jgi:hypothetical protein
MSYERGMSRKNFSLEPTAISISLQPAPLLMDSATSPTRVWLLGRCSPILPRIEESRAEGAV